MRYVPREITARKDCFQEFSVGLLPCDHMFVRFLLFLLQYGVHAASTLRILDTFYKLVYVKLFCVSITH